MQQLLTRIKRKIISLERPAPRALVAWYLSWRWRASVDRRADIRHPFRLELGEGAKIGRCTIICTDRIVLGRDVDIRDQVILDAQCGPMRIGDRTGINPYCVLYGEAGLEIGADVLIATHTVVIPANHVFGRLDVPIREQGVTGRGVRIGNDVWLGTHVVILDGVSIGDGAIVGAGAVVAHDVARGDVVVGVPAHRVRNRLEAPSAAVGGQ